MTGLSQDGPNANFGQMAGEAASGCPTAGLHRVERCCSTAVTGMAASGTGLTLAILPHCWDERTFVRTVLLPSLTHS